LVRVTVIGSHWQTHKPSCIPFNASTTVTLKPFYNEENATALPIADIMRERISIIPAKHYQSANQPASYPKSIVIKIQVPVLFSMASPALFIYTKKRHFVCHVQRASNPAAYDRVCQVVRAKGVCGAKGYFSAELRSPDELIVKVSDILAEQPF